MRQVPLEPDINIALNECSGFATSTQKGPIMAMLISRSIGIALIIIEVGLIEVGLMENVQIGKWSN